MRIAFDRQIFLGEPSFSGMGDLLPLPEGDMTPTALQDADVLVVRSVTRVDEALLAGTKVAFVGSVTAGIDHVDTDHLAARGIRFAHAPGCNARSVATYVASAILGLAAQGRLHLEGTTLGIVGRGQVGGRVARWAQALGLRVIACDPPRQRNGEEDLHPLEAALACSIVTLHVPYTEEGEDATANLLDTAHLARLRPGAWLIHTCRGGVVEEAALGETLIRGGLGGVILDVWAGEPAFDPGLAAQAEIATPHIAGHSLEGKANGTWAVRKQLAAWLEASGRTVPPLAPEAQLPPGPALRIPPGMGRTEAVTWTLTRTCNPWADTQAFRQAIAQCPTPAEAFLQARKTYAPRRDPEAVTITAPPTWRDLLRSFGYRT